MIYFNPINGAYLSFNKTSLNNKNSSSTGMEMYWNSEILVDN